MIKTLQSSDASTLPGQVHLRIMATTDLHMHIYPYDYYADRPIDTAGLARVASHIATIRAQTPNTLLVDNGDFLQGNPMGDYIAFERGMKEGDLHPIIAAMNLLEFDAATLGNHDFNFGLGFLMKTLACARFPVVSANVITRLGAAPRGDKTLLPPYTILNRCLRDGTGAEYPIKIGLIGFVPPQITGWDHEHLHGRVWSRDIIETARAYIPRMQEQGADIIVALSHSGIGAIRHIDGMENASVPLAAIDGVDAIVAGHSHLVFPAPLYPENDVVDPSRGTLHGKPATVGGFWGSHLGLIDMILHRDANRWQIVTTASQVRPIARQIRGGLVRPLVGNNLDVAATARADHIGTLTYIRRRVGKTSAPIHSYFALLGEDPSVQIVAQAQADFIADAIRGTADEGLPILSVAAPFKAGGRGGPENYTHIPPGDLSLKNVADLYPYPNAIRALRLTGAQIKNWLEHSAGIFNRILPGKLDQPLLNPEFPGYNFDVFSGVTYQIDLSRPCHDDPDVETPQRSAAGRIVNLSFRGAPLDPLAEFIVATNSYRAAGGGNFPGADGSTIIAQPPDLIRDLIIRHIADCETLAPTSGRNWSFVAMPGTSVLFDTGPGAARHADGVCNGAISPIGRTPEGFMRFRILL